MQKKTYLFLSLSFAVVAVSVPLTVLAMGQAPTETAYRNDTNYQDDWLDDEPSTNKASDDSAYDTYDNSQNKSSKNTEEKQTDPDECPNCKRRQRMRSYVY